jgi:chromosome partitioning protein
VAVVDTDPQGSLAAWWNAREASAPLFASVDIAPLPEHLRTLERRQVQLVVIDALPGLTEMIRAAVAVADLVLIPARPSPHGLRAVGVIVEMAEAAQKPFCFVVNGATPRTMIALEAVRALAQHGKVAPVTLHQRIDFAASMVDGRTTGGRVTPKSPHALCVPMYNLRISDDLGGEIRVGDVTFIAARKIPRIRRRLGIPERISELRRQGVRLSAPDFFSQAETYAHLKTRRGEMDPLTAEFLRIR